MARGAIVAGKLLAGWLTTLAVAAAILAIGAALGFLRPAGWYWLPALGMMGLYALAASGMGAALGVTLRTLPLVTAASTNIASYLFFLSGGTSVVAFLPDWVQAIAHFMPSYYAVHALDAAVFYASTEELGRDVAVVAATAALTVILGALALRRRVAA